MYDSKVKNRDGMTIVSIKMGLFKRVDNSIVQMLQKRTVTDMCNVNIEKRNCIYSMPLSESIYSVMKKDNGEICELLITSLIQASRNVRRYNLPLENLIIDPKLIFYNKEDNKIIFIYQPYVNGNALFNHFNNISYKLLNLINIFIKSNNLSNKSKQSDNQKLFNSNSNSNINNTFSNTTYKENTDDECETVFLGRIDKEDRKEDERTTFMH